MQLRSCTPFVNLVVLVFTSKTNSGACVIYRFLYLSEYLVLFISLFVSNIINIYGTIYDKLSLSSFSLEISSIKMISPTIRLCTNRLKTQILDDFVRQICKTSSVPNADAILKRKEEIENHRKEKKIFKLRKR